MIMVDKKWNSGLYDFDPKTNKLTKVLKLYKDNDEVYFERFPYAYYPEDYVEASTEDIYRLKHTYYDDNGQRVYDNFDLM
ncbi:hypothetical protein ABHN03_16885 [Paenibacillus sp. NRS-1775]|uniref:hypothetical protein n=1 Tax=unclassified Paenibacillus TaxID=185978 RepID=UPI003D2B9FD5